MEERMLMLHSNCAESLRRLGAEENISGYQIVLVKKIGTAGGWEGGTVFETVAEAYTDHNGDYSMTFNYKLEPWQD